VLIRSSLQKYHYSQPGVKEEAQVLFPHDVVDPARFGLIDFKVLLLGKPGGAPKAQFTENKGYRWHSQK
jgi:hypothetical protein